MNIRNHTRAVAYAIVAGVLAGILTYPFFFSIDCIDRVDGKSECVARATNALGIQWDLADAKLRPGSVVLPTAVGVGIGVFVLVSLLHRKRRGRISSNV